MTRKFLSALKNVFAGDLENSGGIDAMSLVDALASAHDQISHLVAQIRLHADTAPYPQFANDLRRMASEKETDADTLKNSIGISERPMPRSTT
jgi:hypothetical protein